MKYLPLVATALFFAAPAFATGPVVPEPGTISLLGAAAVGGVLLYRKQRGR